MVFLASRRYCRQEIDLFICRRRGGGRSANVQNLPILADIKALTVSTPNLVNELGPAFEKYNEEQFATVKLPGGSRQVIISSHSSLGSGRYYDVESSSSFSFDHATQVCHHIFHREGHRSRVGSHAKVPGCYRKRVRSRAMRWRVLKRTWCKLSSKPVKELS